MKKNNKPTDAKRTPAICGLSALCIAALAGAWLLTREPERDFTPAPTEQADQTDRWEENPGVEAATLPSAAPGGTRQEGTASDNTQTVVSEDGTGSTTSLSDSSTREEALQEKPSEPPVTTDDVTDPDRQPEYDPPVQQAQAPTPPQDSPTDGSGTETLSGDSGTGTPSGDTGTDSSHQGQVYDPVFGWVTPSSVQQDTIDSDGDISKQIGTMGGS
ncbi:DUF6550 family protein [uncultured Acetatifactor sp.]|uniref:DUF6550 family protein n=1 Tax=uncultured Acetatifactor sp. TaxID=1671927 RepID=UPI0026061771|nr:DUF6550 family protein [uncultured Acetatifactor sp.]